MTIYQRIEAGEFQPSQPYPKIDDYATTEGWRQAKLAWKIEDRHLHSVEFRKALAELHDLTANPKEGKVFELAWDYGHSSGLSEVANYYSELAELVK